MTEASLPAGWQSVRLDEISQVIQGQSPPGNTYNTARHGLPFFQGKAEFGDVYPIAQKWCTEPSKLAYADDILISVRAPVGPSNLAPETCCIGRGLAAIRPLDGIPSKYLLYALRHSASRLADVATGSTFEAISGEQLRSHQVALAPLPVQHRIVAEIEKQVTRIDAAVAALQRARANLKRYRASVLEAAVEARLVEQQGAWRSERLEDICPIFVDCPHRTPVYSVDGIPALRPRDVVGGVLDIDSAARVSRKEFERQTERRVPQAGDVIYSRELSYGWAVVVPLNVPVCLSQGMVLMRPCAEVDSRFLALVLNGPIGRRQATESATGSAHPHINLRDIKSYALPIPPLEEQRRIVAETDRHLSLKEVTEASVDKALKRAERLRQSILKKAFEGRLVPQDPNDEPASILLERIHAERGTQAQTASARRGNGRKKAGAATA